MYEELHVCTNVDSSERADASTFVDQGTKHVSSLHVRDGTGMTYRQSPIHGGQKLSFQKVKFNKANATYFGEQRIWRKGITESL